MNKLKWIRCKLIASFVCASVTCHIYVHETCMTKMSHVIHMNELKLTRRISIATFVCASVTCHIYVQEMTKMSHVIHMNELKLMRRISIASFACASVTCHIYVQVLTHSYVRTGSFIWSTWLICTCDIPHSISRHGTRH